MAGNSLTDDPIEDSIRTRIMQTAARYAFHTWEADRARHVRHDETVDTPDKETQYDFTVFEEWWGWKHGGNCGVPYCWGGDAALIRGEDFLDYTGEIPFDEVLGEYNDAGDISTSINGSVARSYNTSGVDCSGFISQVWRLGTKFNSGDLKKLSRPIRFENLKRGDILCWVPGNTIGHVMLFDRFLDETRILVYEASKYNGRVGLTEYEVQYTEISETWKGIPIPTHELTLTRIATYYAPYPCRGPDLIRVDIENSWANFGKVTTGYVPRSIVVPAFVVLVIDRSGSMAEGSKMQDAKAAARLFVDLMQQGDRIGIVPFSCHVPASEPCEELSPVFSLRVIGQADEDGIIQTKRDAKRFIDDLVAEGSTSIGAGVLRGLDLLREITDPLCMMVLLSDGVENRRPYVTNELLDQISSNNIKVITVGFGSNADDPGLALLVRIRDRTKGDYLFAPSGDELQAIFSALLGRVYGADVLQTASGLVASGGTAEQRVSVDSTIGSTTFSLFWRGSELDLTLVQPDGNNIDPSVAETNPKVSFVSGETYQFYKIYNPQAGEWIMRIFGKSTPAEGESYSISVSGMSSMKASITFDKAEYFAGDPVKIEARIEDTIIDFSEPTYVLGAAVKVTVEDPYLNQYSFDLYDDGLHGDGEADDGVYANTFADTSLIGNYNFKVQISGANNRDGQPFTREYSFSHVLNDPALRFPNTPVLDDFNRKKAALGRSWSGAKSGYRIVGQQIHVRKGGAIYWRPGILGADQQAFITLAHVDPSGLEQGLLFKVQDKENHRGNWRKGAISVFYSARDGKVGIKTCVPRQEWKTLGMFDATLQDGDQLGGRAEADGKVRAYVNGAEIGSVDVGSFFAGKDGRIGMWFNDADDAVLDDFGGGGAVSVPVMQSTDDAGPEPSACNYRTDDDNIYFGRCMDGSPIVSGFRFQNVPLPARATIVEAHLEFTVDGPYANDIVTQFFGERTKNPATFGEADRPSDRRMTAAMAPWAMPATNPWPFNQKRRTPAITSIVQELVNLPGWASGNAMAIIAQPDPDVPGDTHRRVFGWDRDPSAAARLVVIYTIEALAGGDDHDDDHDDEDEDDDEDDYNDYNRSPKARA